MNVGGLVLVNYGEPGPIWHCRALLAHAGGNDWAILTPDHDIYIEEMAPSNTDFTGFFYCGEAGMIPAHINPANVYGFDPLTPQELGAFRVQGQVLADAHRAAHGAPAVVPGVAVAAPAPVVRPGAAPAAPPGGAAIGAGAMGAAVVEAVDTRVVLEDGGPHKKGDIVARDPAVLPPASLVTGERGVLPVAGTAVLIRKVKASEAAAYRLEDLRLLPITFDAQGVRRREFNAAVAEMDGAEPAGGGLQLTGPATSLKLMKELRDQAMTPSSFHEYWLRTAEIPRGDRSLYEHECLSRILESMVVVDQLNVPALQSAELICRRLQVIREAHRISPGQPDYSSSDLMMGWKYKRAGAGIDSTLAAHVANELKAEAAIAKEARKAREEQAARRKGPKPGKGKAEGGADS